MAGFAYYENEQRAMIAWLEDRSPDVWHAVANDLNWDFGNDVLEWILSQPTCDRATAMLIFWRAEPIEWVSYPNAEAAGIHVDTFSLVKMLADRANAGFYVRSELTYDGDPAAKIDGIDQFLDENVQALRDVFSETEPEELPWAFPASLVPPIFGREPKLSDTEQVETSPTLRKLFADLGTHFG